MTPVTARTTVALFTRDLRVDDNPVLAAAAEGTERVVPLFVLDDGVARAGFDAPGRGRFLAECLADLDRSLRRLGGRLVVRRGDVVAEVCRVVDEVGATAVHVAADVSAYAARRERRLRDALAERRRELCVHDAVHTVVAPGAVLPSGKDHFAVFTPYHRKWADADWRPLAEAPRSITVPELAAGTLPEAGKRRGGLFPGGESEGRTRADAWCADPVADYAERNDSLADDGTSRLSPYLHFGCVSARALAEKAGSSEGARAFVRQLAWRDFHHQVLAARRDAARTDYRGRGDRWRDDKDALRAWQDGMTGIPIVDAGMRQLLAEGWMHNRARLITGSFLTKTLYVDWREGADHFFAHLLDGDVANNCLNWQWVAGTGTDTRPNRVLNPLRQAERYDPNGEYVRRYVPELSDLDGDEIHRPWRLPGSRRSTLRYPSPIVDLDEARERFLAARGR